MVGWGPRTTVSHTQTLLLFIYRSNVCMRAIRLNVAGFDSNLTGIRKGKSQESYIIIDSTCKTNNGMRQKIACVFHFLLVACRNILSS